MVQFTLMFHFRLDQVIIPSLPQVRSGLAGRGRGIITDKVTILPSLPSPPPG